MSAHLPRSLCLCAAALSEVKEGRKNGEARDVNQKSDWTRAEGVKKLDI